MATRNALVMQTIQSLCMAYKRLKALGRDDDALVIREIHDELLNAYMEGKEI